MTVRMMRSTDRGAPTLAGQQGSMCALLLATLVTGFPAAAPVGITRSGNVATCNMPGHGFVSTQTVSVFGATEAEYNGNQVITVVDADNFTFLVAGTPATPATGTITVGGEKTVGEVSSLTRVGSTVNVWMPGHGFSVGQRARIVGANEAQYNGWQTVVSVIDTDNFTYTLPASATPPSATGTITARYGSCGLGWSQAFTATNKKVLRQGAKLPRIDAVLVVDETNSSDHTYGAGFHMAENATAISTLVNPVYTNLYPQYCGTLKSATANATARPWVVLGDQRTVIIATKPGTTGLPNTDGWMVSYFGDIVSYLPNDAYPQLCAPAARNGSYSFSSGSFTANLTSMSYIPWFCYNYAYTQGTSDTNFPVRMTRNHLGVVGKIQPTFSSGYFYQSTANASLTDYGLGLRHTSYSYDTYPDPVHGGAYMEKIYVKHGTAADNTGVPVTRGEIRGIWNPGHRRTQVAAWMNNDTIVGSGPTAGKTFEIFDIANAAGAWMLIETSDTWSE